MATIENFLLRFKVDGQAAIDKASAGIKSLSDQVSQFGSSTGALGSSLSNLTGKLGPVGLAAGAAAGAFAALGMRAINLAAEISDVAGATGITEGALFNLRNSVIEAGGSSNDFAAIASKLNQSLQAAANGNETLQKSFKDLGVFVTDADGKVRNSEEVLRDIISRFQDGSISAGEYTAAIQLMGEQVRKLDLTKLNAFADPFKDAEIQQLDKYAETFDKVIAGIERRLITVTAKLFNYLDLNRRLMTDTELASQGLKRLPQTFWSGEKIVPMTQEEIAQRDENINEITRLRNQANAARAPQVGGYGAPNAERLKREAEQAARDAKRDAEKLAREQQKLEEQRQKTILKGYEEEARQREENNRDIAEYYKRIDAAAISAWKQVDAYKELRQEAADRMQFEQSLVGMTQNQAQLARDIYDLKQKEKDQLKQLANIENLNADQRLMREQQIRDITKQGIDDLTKRAAALKATQQDFVGGWKKSYDQYIEDSKKAADQASSLFQTFTQGFEDAFVNFVKTGKLSFKDLANSVIADLARIQARQLLVNLFDTGGNILSGLFGRAGGGNVVAKMPYMVGESGPEVFVPAGNGTIIPNYALSGGSGTAITYNINAVDAASFKQLVASDPGFIYAVTEQGRRSLPQTRR